MKTLDRIKQIAIEEGDLKKALDELLIWVKSNRADTIRAVEDLKARLNTKLKYKHKGTISPNDFDVAEAQIRDDFLTLLSSLESKENSKGIIPTYHKYNCDRIDQNDAFNQYYELEQNNKVGYFYLTGVEYESHYGFVNKVARYQGGYLLNINNPSPSTKQLVIRDLHLEASRDAEFIKKDLIRKLFSKLDIMPNDHAPILEKDLNYICQQSPVCQKMSASDYICIFIKIEEDHWMDLDIPALVRWFIETFCGTSLDQDFPNILFFFGVIYFEDGEEKIREEVATELKNAKYVKALPELKNVSRTDILRWFRTYKSILQLTKEERKNKMETFFNQATYDMETVENNLKRIIDEHNNKNLK